MIFMRRSGRIASISRHGTSKGSCRQELMKLVTRLELTSCPVCGVCGEPNRPPHCPPALISGSGFTLYLLPKEKCFSKPGNPHHPHPGKCLHKSLAIPDTNLQVHGVFLTHILGHQALDFIPSEAFSNSLSPTLFGFKASLLLIRQIER